MSLIGGLNEKGGSYMFRSLSTNHLKSSDHSKSYSIDKMLPNQSEIKNKQASKVKINSFFVDVKNLKDENFLSTVQKLEEIKESSLLLDGTMETETKTDTSSLNSNTNDKKTLKRNFPKHLVKTSTYFDDYYKLISLNELAFDINSL